MSPPSLAAVGTGAVNYVVTVVVKVGAEVSACLSVVDYLVVGSCPNVTVLGSAEMLTIVWTALLEVVCKGAVV